MTATARRWPRRLACMRHALVGRLPSRARSRLARWAPPWTRRVVVPVPGTGVVTLTAPDAHGLVSGLYWLGPASYEPAAAATWWSLCRDAEVVVDVGAHVGYYTLLAHAANPRATVHAVEPLPDASHHLHAALLPADAGDRVHAHDVALASATGERRFALAARPPNRVPTTGRLLPTSAAATASRPPPPNVRTVRTTTLNRLLATDAKVDLIKLDVEGAELEVLAGTEVLIDRCGPDLLMEVTLDGDHIPESVTWLIEHGYRLFDPTPRGPQLVAAEALHHMTNTRHSDTARYGEILATRRTDTQITALRQRRITSTA